MDGHVTSLLACEEGRKDVTIAKKRGMWGWGGKVCLLLLVHTAFDHRPDIPFVNHPHHRPHTHTHCVVEKAYEAEGVHAEDCLVEATDGRQWRSFAVEGAVDKVGACPCVCIRGSDAHPPIIPPTHPTHS